MGLSVDMAAPPQSDFATTSTTHKPQQRSHSAVRWAEPRSKTPQPTRHQPAYNHYHTWPKHHKMDINPEELALAATRARRMLVERQELANTAKGKRHRILLHAIFKC
ncbi:hypothetical protein Poli38472_012490 [Pythium oligandrum]|uniref:Uncharacterized protein n=1 Tax=Pythium oligandrum TaxID=41045 RepID=A0A8K1CPS4_PYTOL|nr:hypothetical protein Poli38472_012490 [Pythium oligandrum]|eukprot:TMW67374.1 hypothetical protein Poli38472_012490 [Pythium oligandrum]